ncbi:cytochrome-c oxidase, cbb3-type subunit III [Kaistia granuli]|uniref:cytochrome-c oxidase, cbb3-type subunit III n=1 Tax=Kaistia granuli TaxID=363259 RepID=UPI00035F2F03|nr:cytochrome-c oxidase, cbb3-type subunit III [Kaistia granuli]
MEIGKRDPVTGKTTTGHEWNGIEELDTPVPRVVLFFLFVTILFSVVYWVLMPAWPLGVTYTKGLLGFDDRQVVASAVSDATLERAAWTDKVASMDFPAIQADEGLMRSVRETGRTLFADNCAVCHGVDAKGGPGFPDLTAKAWLWGGSPEQITQTIEFGINSGHPDTRVSQMMAFGRDGVLDRKQINDVVAYVRSLSGAEAATGDNAGRIEAGREVFAANCVACHGDTGKGNVEVGAPDLTDAKWIYGSDTQSVFNTVYGGRQGHMPHWKDRLTPIDVKVLALYVQSLDGAAK